MTSQADTGLALAAGLHPELAVARLVNGHAPVGLLAALAGAGSVVDDPGLVAGYVDAFLAASWTAAWTPSLARLTQPAPSVAQHLRSLVPGTGFLIRLGSDRAVLRRPVPEGVPAFPGPRVLLVTEPGLPNDLARHLADLTRATAVRPIQMPGHWEPALGSRRAVQVALVPAEAGSITVRPRSRCRCCGLLSASYRCSFCHVVGEELPRLLESVQ